MTSPAPHFAEQDPELEVSDFEPNAIVLNDIDGEEVLKVEGKDLYIRGEKAESDSAEEAAAELAVALTGQVRRHLHSLPADVLAEELNRRGHAAQTLPDESLLVSGYDEPLDVLDPDPRHEAFEIKRLARRLAREYRYGNGTKYTVAQHSVLVARLCPEELKLDGLLHDAPEAVLHDLPHPAKKLSPGYRRAEMALERAAEKRYGVDIHARPIREADRKMYVTERASFLPTGEGIDIGDEEPAGDLLPLNRWGEDLAYRKFMDCYKDSTDA